MPGERTWVTEATHRRLVDEREQLRARGADADAAQRARLVELQAILDSVEIGARPDDGLVESGMLVTVRGDDGVETSFVLGDRALLGHDLGDDVTVLSVQSPLGAAVDGRYVGDTVAFAAPRGERSVTIVGATPAG